MLQLSLNVRYHSIKVSNQSEKRLQSYFRAATCVLCLEGYLADL